VACTPRQVVQRKESRRPESSVSTQPSQSPSTQPEPGSWALELRMHAAAGSVIAASSVARAESSPGLPEQHQQQHRHNTVRGSSLIQGSTTLLLLDCHIDFEVLTAQPEVSQCGKSWKGVGFWHSPCNSDGREGVVPR